VRRSFSRRLTRDRERFRLLADLADVADGRRSLADTADMVCALLVPAFADLCMVDVVQRGGLRRLAVKGWGAGAAEREGQLRARGPTSPDTAGSGHVVATGEPQLIAPVTDELIRAGAYDERDVAMLRSLRMRASVVVPLIARGRPLGALTLVVTDQSRRRYRAGDLEFVRVLSGRVALALDNAGLFTELQTAEAQLTAALGGLAEAVTIQNPHGNLIYANQAAADILDAETPQQVLEQPADALVGRYEMFHEDGSPLDPAEFPGRRLLAGQEAEPVVMRVVNRESGEQRWRLVRASAVRDQAGELTMVVNVLSDITAVKRAELAERLLARAGEALGASMDLAATLQQVADLCVPDLADWCSVSIPGEHDDLVTVAVAHTDPEKLALARRVAERNRTSLNEPDGAAAVFRDRTPQLTDPITDDMLRAAARDEEELEMLRALGMQAALIVPMLSGGRSVGVLALVSAESRRRFDEADVALAGELARRAGAAVENARLYTERSAIAHTLQASLLPDELPEMTGWEASALYVPAGDENRVGGDFYEAIALDDGWLLVVGDVSGRGAPAAALTARMRHTLRTAMLTTGSVAEALGVLNRELLSRPVLSLGTAVCVRLFDDSDQAEVYSAGHPLPVLVEHGRCAHVGESGPMLGAFADADWRPVGVRITPAAILVLYSDGVIDAVGPDGHFGELRLGEVLAEASTAEETVARVRTALGDFQVGAQADDIAMLAAQRAPAPMLTPSRRHRTGTLVADAGSSSQRPPRPPSIASRANGPNPSGNGASRRLPAEDAAEWAALTHPGLQETYPAVDSTVAHARHSVARFAAAAGGLEGERLDAVRLAVSEAVTNAVIHAYPDRDGEVQVSAAVTSRKLQVLVIDSGRGLQAPAENPGLGFGLKLMAEASDDFDAVERAEGGTEVRLVFDLDAAAIAG
jgi:serine phosphatase RsbU (regulator of sigma subunit)/anti-sigma regulatory factor (Ser/Thr protein kinase)/PAS domain-containing protein